MASNFRRAFAHLDTTLEDVYTCPEGATAVVIGGQAANVHVASEPEDANIDLAIMDIDDGGTYYLVRNLTIPVGSAIDVVTGKVVLKEGDKILGRADIETALDLVVSILEVE